MPTRDIVTIGGSAGSIEVLRKIVSQFPEQLSAAVFVVVHLSARNRSVLADILNRAGGLPAQQASDGDRIEQGRIYIAPPDRHLVIAHDHIYLTRGPKEGLHRPSINVTFRSAAMRHGSRVIGVLLSGMLDDGAAGLWEIANNGGTTVVQDPDEAEFPSMPLNALQDAAVDYRVPSAEIGRLVTRLVNNEEVPEKRESFPEAAEKKIFSGFTCPECHGPLYELQKPGPVEFRCRVGHVLSLGTLISEQTSTQEKKCYEAMLALMEGADLAEFAANRAVEADRHALRREAEQLRQYAEGIKRLIEERLMPSLD